MEHFRDLIDKAKPNTIVPVFKLVDAPTDAIEYFSKLSNYGKKSNCVLFESADVVDKYGQFSIGSANPCLIVSGKGEDFEIKALNVLGEKILKSIKGDLKFCDKAVYKKNSITGKLTPSRKLVSEDKRLKLKTHMDIIRAVAFKFAPTTKPIIPYCGLFGAISYDFIDQFEDLPKNQEDLMKDNDYELYFLDNLFLIDHKQKKMYLVSNAIITDTNKKGVYENCIKTISGYEQAVALKAPKPKKLTPKKQVIETDTEQKEYEDIVNSMKSHILEGDIFQVVPSRTITTNYNAEPLDIYSALRNLNPSPYMFYINGTSGTLVGSSPETYLRVEGEGEKTVEIRPIAGTKPRGLVGDNIDPELDSRYETELKIDEKELAEHTMLIDLARNDVARISKPGSRVTINPFVVEKYSHVQHLVSTVRGKLKDDLDALHAYLASMNMGTLTGAPKIEAMKLIRNAEKNKRGFYGGSVGYITPSGDFDSCIVIRTMKLKGDKAYIRAGAGIVYDSIPEKEFLETEKKAQACLRAIRKAGGLK